MEKRQKNIFETGEIILAERLSKNITAIQEDFQENMEKYYGGFLRTIQNLLEQVEKVQERNDKGALCYICISYLQSSLYTGSYQLRIDAYDEKFYADLAETCVYWSPDFIFKYMNDDIDYFRESIGNHVVRVKTFEVMDFAGKYIMNYYRIVQQFVADLMIVIMEELDIQNRENVEITFGGYMDQSIDLLKERQVEQ